MSDIVERLRERARKARQVANEFFNGARPLESDQIDTLCEDAIAEIERLQAELREARELLEHIDVQLPSWLCAMSDWEFGGDIALESMDSARARIDAFLAKVQP